MPNAVEHVVGGDRTLDVSFGSNVVARGDMVPNVVELLGIWRGGSDPNKWGYALMIG
jgi:hypothetical protein